MANEKDIIFGVLCGTINDFKKRTHMIFRHLNTVASDCHLLHQGIF